MSDFKKDMELITPLVLEISDRHRAILRIFPKIHEKLLRHLASASIHMAMFMQEICAELDNDKVIYDEIAKKFFKECGCDFNEKKDE